MGMLKREYERLSDNVDSTFKAMNEAFKALQYVYDYEDNTSVIHHLEIAYNAAVAEHKEVEEAFKSFCNICNI